ncbi:MAG: MFS transporter [Acidimicrobiales bacterium]
MAVAAPDDGEGLALRSRRGRLALVATVAASAMASLDATIVNVAVPHIGDDLDAGVSALQWVLTGYLIALASLILLGGALSDRYGRRRVFILGTIWFAAASVVCGVAPNIEVLIGARLLQGIGGALLTPGSLAILQASFQRSDRAAAVGAWSGLGGVAGAIGPFVGGALVDGPGWRWAFLLNVPVAAVAVVTARVAVPESRDHHPVGALDLRGAALVVAGLASATWALTEAGPRGWTDTAVLGSSGVGLLLLVGFVLRIRTTQHPLLPPALFHDRTFVTVNLATVALYGAIGVTFFLVAYQLQVSAGWSALSSGLALLPVTVLMLTLSARSGALAERIGPRLQLTVGPLLTAGGLLLLRRIDTDPSWWIDVFPGAMVLGIGLATFVAPLTATVMASTDPNLVSTASGVNNAIARTASLAALAVIPVVSGLTTALEPGSVARAGQLGLMVAAVLAALAAPVAFLGLRHESPVIPGARRVHCAIDGPPLQPDPQRCPAAA